MAGDIYIKIGDIKGESTDSGHKEWIEVQSWGWGVSQMASAVASSSGGGSTQRADFQDFSFSCFVDAAAPELFLKCAQGTHIETIEFEQCRASGEEKIPFLKFKFSHSIISSCSFGGGEGGFPNLNVTINYGKVEQEYDQQKRADGSSGGKISAGWNLEENKKV